MRCIYCNKELPKVINSRRDICECEKAQKDWFINLNINDLKKQLSILTKELSGLKK